VKSAGLLGVLLLAAGCASAPRPGPTLEGVALPVTAREKVGARRQAIESALPMFMTPAARREKSAAIDKAVFSVKKMKPFIGYLKVAKSGSGLAEVKLDPLSAALQRAGLIRPPGYSAGPQVVLLAMGNRAVGPTSTERFSADALEVALFGRGIQAQDADDQLLKLEHPITAKTEEGTVAQAAAGGWSWLATGGTSNVARHEVQSDSWRGRARFSLALYGVDASTTPARLDADGEALDVSSASAVTHAIEAAAQVAALRVEGLMTRKRVGRSTIAVMVSGYKDPAFINQVVGDLRGTEGIAGAALISWHGDDEMAVIHAYAVTMKAEELAAKLLMSDPKLRITAVETEDGRLTIAGPPIPASEDTGQAGQ
jgi:hypothetical protein